jgi:CRISPR/Cas system-associated exonuclease Cas4 (RecB family)
VERIVFEGLIGDAEKMNLTKELHEVLSVPEIAEYFHPSYTVFAEREIILPGGEILRPDRVIEKDNKAIVIDFKTGRRENKHETQIKQYADVLRTMNFKMVEAKIIYLAEKKIVDVN